METKYFTYSIDSSRGTIYRTYEGQPGPKGDKGDSATVSVGTVTTGQPGTSVIITNSGTSSDAVFNFTIPRGERGEQGIQGEQGPQGIQGIQGVQGPAGADGQAATIAVGTVTSGSVPSVTNSGTSSAAVFDFVLVPGQNGTNGQDGAAATISVGTTTTGQPGTSASVTNSGTSSAAVFDFVIPQGQTGQTGATGPGVPQGGTAGQILSKIDGTDYNTQWIDAPKGGNVTHDVVLKVTVTANQTLTFRGIADTIDWGDGDTTSPASRASTHTYEEAGNYVVTIDGITEWGDSSQSGINRSILSANVISEAKINTTSIGDHAFRECSSLTSVKAPYVQELGTGAFYYCSGLTGNINNMIPTWNLTRIKSWCFYETNFTGTFDASHLIFKKENGGLDQFTYSFPKKIDSIEFPKLAVSLPLDLADYLESIVIPDGTRVIGKIAVSSNNSKMYYARIPGSVQSLMEPVFSNFRTLKTLYVEDGAFSDFDSWSLETNTETYSELSVSYSNSPTFCKYCRSLTNVRLPEGMKALGVVGTASSYTFSSFSEGIFTEFNIPSTVKQIWNICQDCTHLTTLTFPAGLEKISSNSFTGCTSLTTLHMLGATPPSMTANCFTNCPLTAIYVPASAVSDYQNHTDWSRFSSIIQAEPTT